MLNWIVVNIIHVAAAIHFISNLVFPKAPLPDVLFSLGDIALARVAMKRIVHVLVNALLIIIHRFEKSSSSGGKAHRQ